MKVEVNISKVHFIVLLAGILLVAGVLIVIAYNPAFDRIAADAVGFGHSSDEVVLRMLDGSTATLQDYLINTQSSVIDEDDALGAPLMFIVGNFESANTEYTCLNDIDLDDYCDDGDGCIIKIIANRKTNPNDEVIVQDFAFYAEEDSFSNSPDTSLDVAVTSLGDGGRGEVADAELGDSVRNQILSLYEPFGYGTGVRLHDYKINSLPGCTTNDNSIYPEPFSFTLAVYNDIRAKMIVYDSYSIKDPVEVNSGGLPDDVYVYATDFSGDGEGCSYEVDVTGCSHVDKIRTGEEWNWEGTGGARSCHGWVLQNIDTRCPGLQGSPLPSGPIAISWNSENLRLGDIVDVS